MVENEQEFTLLIEYFKSLRIEIHLRIIEHTRLIYFKLLSIGIIIWFLMERFYTGKIPYELSSPWPYFFWIVPMTAIIFDLLIAGNMRDINNLGHYIKDYFEKKSFRKYLNDPEFRFWEECVAQADTKYHCYTVTEMSVIWLFSFVSFLFSIILQTQNGFKFLDKYNIILFASCGVLLLYALMCLVMSIKMEREFSIPEIGNVPKIKWRKEKWLKVF